MDSTVTMNANFIPWPRQMAIRFKKLDPRAVIPQFKTDGSAGLDLVALEDMCIWSGEVKKIRTGLAWSAPPYIVGRIVPRSSMFAKGFDCDGTIDSDYRGEILVQLRFISTEDRKAFIKAGDRIAQLLPLLVGKMPIQEVDELDDTTRGSGGFGSTGA